MFKPQGHVESTTSFESERLLPPVGSQVSRSNPRHDRFVYAVGKAPGGLRASGAPVVVVSEYYTAPGITPQVVTAFVPESARLKSLCQKQAEGATWIGFAPMTSAIGPTISTISCAAKFSRGHGNGDELAVSFGGIFFRTFALPVKNPGKRAEGEQDRFGCCNME